MEPSVAQARPAGRQWATAAGVALAAGLALLYVAVLGWMGVLSFRAATPVSVVFGISLLIFAAFGVWGIAAELRFGWRATRLTERLAAEGGMPEELAVAAVGRPDRAAAIAAIDGYRDRADSTDAQWHDLLRLALVLDAAGRRREARRASVRALRLMGDAGR